MYRRTIEVTKARVEMRDGKVFIDGQAATSFTFSQNYWMMGDNRHRSLDSRPGAFARTHCGQAGIYMVPKERSLPRRRPQRRAYRPHLQDQTDAAIASPFPPVVYMALVMDAPAFEIEAQESFEANLAQPV